MKIYAGNLSYEVTENDLRAAFEEFGQVESANVIMDKYSGRSKGFGFVEMPVQAEAEAAIEALNGKDLQGRNLNVNEARPRENRENRGGDRGGRGSFGGGRGGFGGGRGNDRGGDRGSRGGFGGRGNDRGDRGGRSF